MIFPEITPPAFKVQTIGIEPHVRGTAVYLDYDQVELDAAYDQVVYSPNRDQVHQRNLANSDATRERIGNPKRFAYGPTPVEHFDFFRSKRADAPIFVFIHGGAWRATGIERYAFAAEPFVSAGINVAILQFMGIEEAGGNLRIIVDQVRRGVAWIAQHAARIGGDPARIYAGGHSSGAHLTSCVVITDWSTYGVPADILKGALCCSGIYDLRPVALSKRSAYVTFDDAAVDILSPIRHLEKIGIPLVIGYGTCETPEFQRQNRDFAAALLAAGKSFELVVAQGYNHFEIAETFGNPYGPLGRAALDLLQR